MDINCDLVSLSLNCIHSCYIHVTLQTPATKGPYLLPLRELGWARELGHGQHGVGTQVTVYIYGQKS